MDYLILSVIFAVPVAYLGYKVFINWRDKSIVTKTPLSSVGSMGPGFVHVAGKAATLSGQQLVSPVNGVPCVYYEVKFEYNYGTYNKPVYKTLYAAKDGVPFCVEEKTGTISVLPDGARIVVAENPDLRVIDDGDVTEKAVMFLRDQGIDIDEYSGAKRGYEKIIRPGGMVEVYGTAVHGSKGEDMFIGGTEKSVLWITDSEDNLKDDLGSGIAANAVMLSIIFIAYCIAMYFI